jgi:hypothetical protein
MSANVGFGWVQVPAPVPQGPLTGTLNRGGGVLQTVRGWFCWGCRGTAPESVGVMVFYRDHSKCGGER